MSLLELNSTRCVAPVNIRQLALPEQSTGEVRNPLQSRPPNKAGGWICAAATYGTGEAEEGRESVALRHNLATLCAHCCLVQASRRRCSFHTPQCHDFSYILKMEEAGSSRENEKNTCEKETIRGY
ncbi:hypothetical protein J6590_019545 [Homalodisca vitripennis]|nr:hypothetical protein J6590_019545 [Homalodisca vitripennis]